MSLSTSAILSDERPSPFPVYFWNTTSMLSCPKTVETRGKPPRGQSDRHVEGRGKGQVVIPERRLSAHYPIAGFCAGLDIFVDDEFQSGRQSNLQDPFGLKRQGAREEPAWSYLPTFEQTRKENFQQPAPWAGMAATHAFHASSKLISTTTLSDGIEHWASLDVQKQPFLRCIPFLHILLVSRY